MVLAALLTSNPIYSVYFIRHTRADKNPSVKLTEEDYSAIVAVKKGNARNSANQIQVIANRPMQKH